MYLRDAQDRITIICRRCDRRGEYPKANLIRRFGADVKMPDLPFLVAREVCDRAKQPLNTLDGRCEAVFGRF